MAKHLSPVPRLRFIDADGDPLIGGKLYTYEAGGTTPIVTHTDATGGTENTNPIILDAYGEADVWIALQQQYKFVLKDSLDNTIRTIDDIEYDNIFGENITWTGDHDFQGTVTLGAVAGNVAFAGSVTIATNLYVTGTFGVDGATSFNDSVTADSFIAPLLTLGTGAALSQTGDVVSLTSIKNVTVVTDGDGTPRTFDLREDGKLRLPVNGSDNLDAATVGQMNTAIAAAAPTGLIPVAIGCVVSNSLVAGSIGIASVAHPGTGTYTVTLSAATSSTAKTIVFTTIRGPSPLRNWCAFPVVNSTTEITVTTGGGNSWAITDQDFNIMVFSLP